MPTSLKSVLGNKRYRLKTIIPEFAASGAGTGVVFNVPAAGNEFVAIQYSGSATNGSGDFIFGGRTVFSGDYPTILAGSGTVYYFMGGLGEDFSINQSANVSNGALTVQAMVYEEDL